MSCIHRLNDYGLIDAWLGRKLYAVAEATATSSSRTTTASSFPYLLATSAHVSKSTDDDLCRHQKNFFAHLKPRAMVVGTLRVAIQQGSIIMAGFMSEQLELDMKRNQLVLEGKLSRGEADQQAQEWEATEWEKRWKPYPNKFFAAFAKYHVITLLMRSYEHLASLRYDRIVMDKLTMDPFVASNRIGKDNTQTTTTIVTEMFHTTFWAFFISYLADYTVHQTIICYGYYVYVRRKREQASNPAEKDAVLYDGAVWTSMLRKSTQLFVSRAFALVCSATGGALGTLWWPGWGCIVVSNMGEAAGSVIMDDGQASSSSNSSSSNTESN